MGRPKEKQGWQRGGPGGWGTLVRYGGVPQMRGARCQRPGGGRGSIGGDGNDVGRWCTAGEHKGQRGQMVAAREDDFPDQSGFPFPLMTEKY
jgi:hypothetical protein